MKINGKDFIEHRVTLSQVDYPDGIKSIQTILCTKEQAKSMVGSLYKYNKAWFIESVEVIEYD